MAADSTGLETEQASYYYCHRTGKKRRHYLKLSLACDTKSGAYLSVHVSRGPCSDAKVALPLLSELQEKTEFKYVFMDKGFDSADVHKFVREELGARCVIPVRKRPRRAPKDKYRHMMKYHFPKRLYGQRQHIESCISRGKRRIGSFLRANRWDGQVAEALIWVLVYNIAIIAMFFSFCIERTSVVIDWIWIPFTPSFQQSQRKRLC